MLSEFGLLLVKGMLVHAYLLVQGCKFHRKITVQSLLLSQCKSVFDVLIERVNVFLPFFLLFCQDFLRIIAVVSRGWFLVLFLLSTGIQTYHLESLPLQFLLGLLEFLLQSCVQLDLAPRIPQLLDWGSWNKRTYGAAWRERRPGTQSSGRRRSCSVSTSVLK